MKMKIRSYWDTFTKIYKCFLPHNFQFDPSGYLSKTAIPHIIGEAYDRERPVQDFGTESSWSRKIIQSKHMTRNLQQWNNM